MAVVDLVFAQGIEPPHAADLLMKALEGANGFRQQQEQQLGEAMFTLRWLREGDKPVAVDLTFDRSVPMLMASVIGDDAPQVDRTAEELRRTLGDAIDPPERLLDAAAAASADPALLVRAAVVYAHRFDGRLFALIDDALRSQDMAMRQGAAKAAALVKYGQLSAVLRQAVDREKDETTARMLGLAMSKVRNASG